MRRKDGFSSLEGFGNLKEMGSLVRLKVENCKKWNLKMPMCFYSCPRWSHYIECVSLRANDLGNHE